MNNTLALAAGRAVTAPGFPSQKGWCQKWIRLTLESCYGRKYAAYMGGTAKETARNFVRAGIGKRYNGEPLEPGDLLYKTVGSGGFGHCGIWTGTRVAENSSYHARRDNNARGFRTLEQFGDFQVLVRLPDPQKSTQKHETQNRATPQEVSVIIARGSEVERVSVATGNKLNGNLVHDILKAADVEIAKAGLWDDGTPVLYLK